MEVRINNAAPPPPPPKTYDLLGLTEGEVRALRAALGGTPWKTLANRGVSRKDAIAVRRNLRQTLVKYTFGSAVL